MSTFSVDLRDQAAVVTGAGAGVGKAVALALARCGAAVLVNDLNPDRCDDVVAEIHSFGGRAVDFQGDVSNRFQASAMIEHAREAFGRIHLLVNAAGAFKTGSALLLDEWDWRRLVDVNLTGTFFCSQLLGRVMAEAGGGVMVNLGSTAALSHTLAEGVAFTATKAGIIGLTRQLAREYAASGIRVNAVCPGLIADDDLPGTAPAQIPLGRAGTPQDVANAVLFLCSDAAAFMTGQTLIIDGGASL